MKVVPEDEQLREAVTVLGDEYGRIYHHCLQHFYAVAAFWDYYEALFSSADRVGILNKSDGQFWYDIQGLIFDHVLLAIARLTDPRRSAGKTPVTIQAIELLETSKHKARLASRTAAAVKASAFARDWRHRRLAHSDLDLLIGGPRLLRATRGRVTRALLAIHWVLRWVQHHHFNGDMHVPHLGISPANTVLNVLNNGARWQARYQEDVKTGIFPSPFASEYAWRQTGEFAWSSKQRPMRLPRLP